MQYRMETLSDFWINFRKGFAECVQAPRQESCLRTKGKNGVYKRPSGGVEHLVLIEIPFPRDLSFFFCALSPINRLKFPDKSQKVVRLLV